MSFFNVEVTGIDSLDKDFEEHEKAIEARIPIALGIVGAEMVKDLQAIIEGYFYKSYTPRHYKRSGAMKDDSAFDYLADENELLFLYEPDTSHNGLDAWVQDKPTDGEFSLPRHPDDLIVWGQHSHFDGTDHEIPARPFWNYFLESQGNEKVLDAFIRGMSNKKFHVIKDAGETIDLSEYRLASDTSNVAPYQSGTSPDDELPF